MARQRKSSGGFIFASAAMVVLCAPVVAYVAVVECGDDTVDEVSAAPVSGPEDDVAARVELNCRAKIPLPAGEVREQFKEGAYFYFYGLETERGFGVVCRPKANVPPWSLETTLMELVSMPGDPVELMVPTEHEMDGHRVLEITGQSETTWASMMTWDTPEVMISFLSSTRIEEAAAAQRQQERVLSESRYVGKDHPHAWSGVTAPKQEGEPLLVARGKYEHALAGDVPWPREAARKPPRKSGLALRSVDGPLGALATYTTPDPKDGKKHPAVLWLHGGFGGLDSSLWEAADAADDQSVRTFVDAGLVVMALSPRGENDNPGTFEYFYGEVEDVLAARADLAKLPYVDPERIYLAGHSVGGTLALLAATTGESFRAVFSFGAWVDFEVIAQQGAFPESPAPAYDTSETRSNELRSANRFVQHIKSPTFFFEGEHDADGSALAMGQLARDVGAPFEVFLVPNGNHYNILRPLEELLVRKIQADTGDSPIRLSAQEIRGATVSLRPWSPE